MFYWSFLEAFGNPESPDGLWTVGYALEPLPVGLITSDVSTYALNIITFILTTKIVVLTFCNRSKDFSTFRYRNSKFSCILLKFTGWKKMLFSWNYWYAGEKWQSNCLRFVLLCRKHYYSGHFSLFCVNWTNKNGNLFYHWLTLPYFATYCSEYLRFQSFYFLNFHIYDLFTPSSSVVESLQRHAYHRDDSFPL